MNFVTGLTNASCPICYWQTFNHWPRCQFSMNANKMWCKSRFFIFNANASWQRCNCNFLFMMQMSHARMKMQSLFMMMLVHAFKPWRKCLLIEMEMRMSFNEYVMMQMSLCKNAMMQMTPCGYAMMQMSWRKHNLFKNSLCFLIEASSMPKYLQNLIYYSWKVIFFFYLRLPKEIGDHC